MTRPVELVCPPLRANVISLFHVKIIHILLQEGCWRNRGTVVEEIQVQKKTSFIQRQKDKTKLDFKTEQKKKKDEEGSEKDE